MVVEMSYELITSREPMVKANVPELTRFCMAAKSVIEIASARGDTHMNQDVFLSVTLSPFESRRLLTVPDEVSIGKEMLPREVWLVEDTEYTTPAAVADAAEFDLQCFPQLNKSTEVLGGIVRMLSRLARARPDERITVVRTQGHAIAWPCEYPHQYETLVYGLKGSTAQPYVARTINHRTLEVGEANGWIQRFNDYAS